MKQNQTPNSRIWLAGPVALGIIAITLVSTWSYTLPHLIESGDTRDLILHLVGMPILLIGLGTLLYGGFVFGRDTTSLFHSERYQKWDRILKEKPNHWTVLQARVENLRLLWQNWQNGLAWVAAGLSLFVIGHFLAVP